MQPLWPLAVAERLHAAVGYTATVVAHGNIRTAVGHRGHRGPRRMVVKSVKFSIHRIFLQNNLKIYKKIHHDPKL
jgi:hypothetical protein